MLVPLLALMTVFNAGTAMIAGRLTTHFVDTTQILPFMFRLLLYVSGVIFSVDAYVDDNGFLNTLFTLNPYYCFISLGRWTHPRRQSPDRSPGLGNRVVDRDLRRRIRLVPSCRGGLRP